MVNVNLVFEGATTSQERAKCFLNNWLQKQDDNVKLFFQINKMNPHSIFNCACKYFDSKDIQNIDWFGLYKGDYGRVLWGRQLDETRTYPLVKYSKPQKGEEELIFKLLEDNGDRVLIECVNSGMTIAPTSVISKDEIKFVG